MEYTITPLIWTGELKEEYDAITTSTVFGNYSIVKTADGYRWEYCFDEYYDEGYGDCETIEEGKRLAEEDWRNRLIGCLTPVQREESEEK